MRNFLKFGALMTLLFVFILPAVFPVSGASDGDGNPSIKSARENLVSETTSDEGRVEDDADEYKDTTHKVSVDGVSLFADNSEWVCVQDIETTVREQRPHTAFNPIAREELSENANAKGNKWVAIRDGSERVDGDAVSEGESESEEERRVPDTTFVPEYDQRMTLVYDEDDIQTLPAYPTKGKKDVVVNV